MLTKTYSQLKSTQLNYRNTTLHPQVTSIMSHTHCIIKGSQPSLSLPTKKLSFNSQLQIKALPSIMATRQLSLLLYSMIIIINTAHGNCPEDQKTTAPVVIITNTSVNATPGINTIDFTACLFTKQ